MLYRFGERHYARMSLQTHKLIGRGREQAELLAALDADSAGGRGIVLLAGEAGIGKTRLADECLAQSQLRILRAQAREGGNAPYAPLVALFRAFLRANPHGLAGARSAPPTARCSKRSRRSIPAANPS